MLKRIPGELSNFFRIILLSFFSKHCHNMATSGIELLLHNGSSLRVFVNFGMMLSDEAALHAAYQCKGASGLKPCALCSNVFNMQTHRDVVGADPTGIARYHTDCTIADLRLHNLDTVTAIARRLQAAAAAGISSRNLQELETRLGFNYAPHGVLQDDYLRPIADPTQHLMYDTMHIYYVNGIFGNHVGRLVEALKPFGVTYETIGTYVSRWTLPSRGGKRGLADGFVGKRAKASWDDGRFKCTASEALSLVPILGQFVEASVLTMANNVAKQHGASFMLLVKVLELIEGCARDATTPRELQHAIVAHLRSFRALYGVEWMPIKFHLSLHLPMFLQRWGFLPNCFVLERKHRTPKKCANDMRNTSSQWETSVLRECTAAHFAELAKDTQFKAGSGLEDAYTPSKAMHTQLLTALGIARDAADELQIATSRMARINEWETCYKSDVVLVKSDEEYVGQIMFFVSVSDPTSAAEHVLCGLARWRRISGGRRCSKWQRCAEVTMVMVDEIAGSLVWADSADGIVSVLSNARL